MADGMRSGFYFVAFADPLGQQAKLTRFKGVAPTTDDERAIFRQLVDNTAGVVRNERESIAQWLARDVTDEALAKIAPERRAEFAHIITRAAFQTGFSDCFVVAFPKLVDGVDERLSRARSVYDLWTALLGLSVLRCAGLSHVHRAPSCGRTTRRVRGQDGNGLQTNDLRIRGWLAHATHPRSRGHEGYERRASARSGRRRMDWQTGRGTLECEGREAVPSVHAAGSLLQGVRSCVCREGLKV